MHFVRCDDNVHFTKWSQKDGSDQITNFDFAGQPIVDPSKSNWIENDFMGFDSDDEYAIEFQFDCFLFVPQNKVDIL